MLTKGDFKEQEQKIINAGIDKIVNGYFIVPEKEDAVYQQILTQHNWKAKETCMVGNSPKSDINPALRVGMYAIYIPYANTWKLDYEEVKPVQGRYFKVQRFSDLKDYFL
ncbi:HAD family hydrolase [Calditrichota bacterium GD2]